ncbi:MAG: glycosyltransferase family 4 protein, partial [Steroidobacteraceae bacterium]
GALRIDRLAVPIAEINLLDAGCWRKFMHAARRVRALSGRHRTTLHCLRSFPEGLVGLLCKVRAPLTTRLVVFAHGEEVLVAHSSGQLRLIAKAVYRSADLVIANSRSTATLVRGLCPGAKVVCIPPGVDAASYSRPREELGEFRKQWSWPADTVIVSTVARMEPRKNQAAVLQAVAALRNEGLPVAYVCGGEGAERPALSGAARELRLEPWTRFPGALDDERKILTYAASDLHAMPSIRVGEMIEGFGIVFLEAAAAGLPSVCGNVGGQAEAVVDGKTGFVVDGLDANQVRRAIGRLIVDAGLRRRMGDEARSWAKQHDWGVMSSAVLAAVHEHVGR